MVASVLQAVQNGRHIGNVVAVRALFNEAADFLFVHNVVDELVVLRQHVVEDDAANARFEAFTGLHGLEIAERLRNLHVTRSANRDASLNVYACTSLELVERVLDARENAALAREAIANRGEEVHTDDHVLSRNGQRAAMSRAT